MQSRRPSAANAGEKRPRRQAAPPLNSMARYTRTAKQRNMPGYDPQILSFHSIMRDPIEMNPFHMEGRCFRAISVRNPGTTESVLLIPPRGLAHRDLPMELRTRIADVLARPGTYTWLLFIDGMIAAARAFTRLEIHSKHIDIYTALQKPVVAAGEMRVHADRSAVEYNFNSGTFMEKIMRNTDGSEAAYAKYNKYLTDTIKGAGGTVATYVPDTDLLKEVVAEPEDLAKYKALGYKVLGWPEENSDMCTTYRSLVRSPMTMNAIKESMRESLGRNVTEQEITFSILRTDQDYFGEKIAVAGGKRRSSRRRTRRTRCH